MIKRKGFTFVEIMVAIAIFGLLSLTVLANFRSSVGRTDVNVLVSKIRGDIEKVRTMGFSGAVLSDGTFPSGGYGIHFDTSSPNQYVLYVASGVGTHAITGHELPNGIVQLGDKIELMLLCSSNADTVSTLPCTPGEWQAATPHLDIFFEGADVVRAMSNGSAVLGSYVGGVFQHSDNLKKGYFYISLKTGYVDTGLITQ